MNSTTEDLISSDGRNCVGWAARDPSGFLSPLPFHSQVLHLLRSFANACLIIILGFLLKLTRGGLSNFMVVDERFCLKIPDNLTSELAAPLLCAGATVYSPMVHHGANEPGKSMGVLGLGGLGHMAFKFGKAFGLKVTVLSTSPSKKEEALTVLGADEFLVTSQKAEMEDAASTLDFMIDTASANHPLDLYLPLLKTSSWCST